MPSKIHKVKSDYRRTENKQVIAEQAEEVGEQDEDLS